MKPFLTLIGILALAIIVVVGAACCFGYIQHKMAPKTQQAST